MSPHYDFLIVGAGVFGLTAAIELAKRSHRVAVINPNTIPHHLAASTDVTKSVRMEYGSDQEYFRMAEASIAGWHAWNAQFQETLYHEVGLLMLGKAPFDRQRHAYEYHSLANLKTAGYPTEQLDAAALRQRFPVVNTEVYGHAVFNPKAGYARSGRVIEVLAAYARSLQVDLFEGQTAESLQTEKGRFQGLRTREGRTFKGAHAIIAAGAHTPYLLPELRPYLKVTGHPLFWLQPTDPTFFQPPHFVNFFADISTTGWYGFPYLPEHGIVKIGKHATGLEIDPQRDDRQVTDADVRDMRAFLREAFPSLAEAPLVHTRRCLYTDTLDGHFWIDRHPEIEGLSVSSGGSGHAFKMAPILGQMTADMAEGKPSAWSERYAWRELAGQVFQEEARCLDLGGK